MYPEEQVEEEEHVLDAADATASHDGVQRRCKTDRFVDSQAAKIDVLICDLHVCLVCRIFPTLAAKVWREAHLFRRRHWRTEMLVWTGVDRFCGSKREKRERHTKIDENCHLMLYILIFLMLPD